MKIGLLYGGHEGMAHGSRQDHLAAEAVLVAADAVESACRNNGWPTFRLAVDDLGMLAENISASAPTLVFNLVESVSGDSSREPEVPRILDVLGMPYTGSTGDALALALDKPACRSSLSAAGLPVAPGGVMGYGDAPFPVDGFPLMVKPAREDASHGLSAASVVFDEESARAQVDFIVRTYRQPALVETFLPGREFSVSMLDGQLLGVSGIDFSGLPAGAPQIVDYRAKWEKGSAEYLGTVPYFPDIPHELKAAIQKVASKAWRVIGLRGYARIDLRLDVHQHPVVIDINANPDLSPEAGLSRAATHAGLSYDMLIGRIVRKAVPHVNIVA